MVSFDKTTVRETLSKSLDEHGVTEEQDGIPEMIDSITEAVMELYEKAAPKGKKGKSTNYTRFISHLSKNKDAVADLKVHLNARFGKDSGTKNLYTENMKMFPDGAEVTVGSILSDVEKCMSAAEMKKSQMTQNAFVWNMLNDEDRAAVMQCTTSA